jgi:hypothetical protein
VTHGLPSSPNLTSSSARGKRKSAPEMPSVYGTAKRREKGASQKRKTISSDSLKPQQSIRFLAQYHHNIILPRFQKSYGRAKQIVKYIPYQKVYILRFP